jgi:hypothetical protein
MSENYYYKVVLNIEVEVGDKGKTKNKREEYIVEAISPTDVEVKIANHMKGGTEDYEISSIVVTKILDIIK